MGETVRFAPIDVGRWFVWGATALLLALLPLVFSSGFAITLLSQMGIMVVFALSFNMIFGQGGMLSFGHAVYSGLGAFFAIHALNWIGAGELRLPVSLVPLVGGLAGALFGVVFGYVTTKKAGTPFAMITLGIGEMVFAASLMFPAFFGGEGGISSNRVAGQPFLGITFGPGIEVYYLIAAWCFACMVAMFAFTHTPLGRIANAVRDNPERAEFIGYNTQRVRFFVLTVSAFFAGIAGGLSAINFEIVTAENVSAIRSGGVLLATFIGGAMFFFGPILGAVIFVFFAVALSDYTKAWQFYLGVFFVAMVMYAPGGVASLLLMNLRVARHRLFGRLRDPYAGVLLSGLILLVGVVMVVEMSYHLTLNFAAGSKMRLFGFPVDSAAPEIWVLAAGVLAAGACSFEVMRRYFVREWGAVQVAIEEQLQREAGVR
ncbi:MAG: branched-chain amino acid ABC transporter permease [Burkholderiaceae bacterium]|nr:branched-chain amino acid ABC transporter permease [Burkholderiaceae bacterium]